MSVKPNRQVSLSSNGRQETEINITHSSLIPANNNYNTQPPQSLNSSYYYSYYENDLR